MNKKNKMGFWEELKARGIIDNVTNETKIMKALEQKKAIYIGFDPSAASIHLGNFVVVNVLNLAQKCGLDVIGIIGGATGNIGDPSGKRAERKLLDKELVDNNVFGIESQIRAQLPKAKIINNKIFYENVNLFDFLRDTGKFINVAHMLNKEMVKSRIDDGISFAEFSYTLIQANDFFQLWKHHNVGIQMGGADQWGNIITGTELIRKKTDENSVAAGITIKLLLKADGTKFGKSEEGAIYLDEKLTSPWKMWQFLINQKDEDIHKLLNFLSNFEVEEIENIMKVHNMNKKSKWAQLKLCENIITRIHGVKCFKSLNEMATKLFNANLSDLNKTEWNVFAREIPNIKMGFKFGDTIADLLVRAKIASSKREAKEWINQGAIQVGMCKITTVDEVLDKFKLIQEHLIIKKGKKDYFLINQK